MDNAPLDKPNARPIGIVAGGGEIVLELVENLRQQLRPFCVAAIRDEADERLDGAEVRRFSWGEIGRILSFFRQKGCENLLLLGRVQKRPDFRSIIGDPGTLVRIPKIVAAMRGGDDSLLQKVVRLLMDEGFIVIGMHDVAPALILRAGDFGRQAPAKTFRDDISKGKRILHAMGPHDIGQALVIQDGRILALEAAEGTDNMLRRIAELRLERRITTKPQTGLLVKGAKPQQDLRVDLPTIGPQTIRLAAAAGLAGILCEADVMLIAQKSETYALARQYGLFLTAEKGFRDE